MNKRIFLVFFIGLLVISSSWFYFSKLPIEGDSIYYYIGAKEIKQNFNNIFISKRIGVNDSLNMIFQGVIMYLPGDDISNVFFSQLLLFAITGVFIFKLSRIIFHEKYAWCIFFFYLLNHTHWRNVYNFKPGVWVILLLSIVFYYIFLILKNNQVKKNWYLFSVFSGLLLLQDFRYFPHMVFVTIFILLFEKKLILALEKIKILIFILLIIIAPWIFRQYIVFNKFFVISDITTITIHKFFNTEKYQSLIKYKFVRNTLTENELNKFFFNIADSLKLTPGELTYVNYLYNQSDFKKINLYKNPKYEYLIKNGLMSEAEVIKMVNEGEHKSKAELFFSKVYTIWKPFQFNYVYIPWNLHKVIEEPWSLFNNLNRIFTVGILLPFLIIGFIFSIIKRHKFFILIGLILIIHTFIHVFTWVQPRYLQPVLPIITMMSIFGFNSLKEKVFIWKRGYNNHTNQLN